LSKTTLSGTDQAIHFVLHTTWQDLPLPVQHQAKRCLLDLLGALLAGTQTPVARLMADLAVAQYPGDEAAIVGTNRRASLIGATLANGFAANALDIDDGYRLVKGHPGACVLPVLLAAAERRAPLSGASFLAALIVGYEIGIRAGLIRHALYTVYHSSGSWGAIAGAAVAGRVWGFDAGLLRHAMGAAEYHAPIAPMMKGIVCPSMGKDSIGWGAMVGIASALMAERGFTGIEPLFSDIGESADSDTALGTAAPIPSLGQRYEVLNLYFKPFASCRWAQPAVAGALQIARQHGLKPHDIVCIRVDTFAAAQELSRARPRNTEEAQYNLAFPMAAALVDGEVGPRQVLPPRLFAEEILSLADLVEVRVKDEYEALFPEKRYADVEVETRDGRVYRAARQEAIWEPPNTLPADGELEAKFRWLVSPVLGDERTATLGALVWGFDQVNDVRQLLQLLQ